MKGKVCCFVIIALQLVSSVVGTSRPFVHQSGPIQSSESPQTSLHKGSKSSKSPQPSLNKGSKSWEEEENSRRGSRKIGSSPPSCDHKCYGCIPCEAIQVPTTSRHSHIGIQYTNYEPENWKCKCGPLFYSP